MDLTGALPGEAGNRRGRRVDLIIVGFGLFGGLLMFAIGQYRQAFPDVPAAWLLVPLVVCCAALLWRRTAPLVSVFVGVVAVAADVVLGPSLATVLIFTQVLYDACIHGKEWLYRALLAVSVVLTVVVAAVSLVLVWDVRSLSLAVLLALVTVLPILTGIQVRHHRDRARAERQRAEQLARLAELDRANAIAAERARMARELHDVIANHMSAVAIHATAALTVTNLGADDVQQALRVIRENSVRGLAEMRQMIEFLRDPAASGESVAGLGGLEELLDRSRRAGLATDLSVRGQPADLPVAIDLAAYRIVQESLTNALKHGGSGNTTVEIGYEPRRLTIAVTSRLPDGQRSDPPGGGAGVIGMRERTLLLGGEFDAGVRNGRWLVSARLPIESDKT